MLKVTRRCECGQPVTEFSTMCDTCLHIAQAEHLVQFKDLFKWDQPKLEKIMAEEDAA